MKHIIFIKDGERIRINGKIFGEISSHMYFGKIGICLQAHIPLSIDDAMDLYLNYVDDFMLIEILKNDYDIEILNTGGLTRYNLPYVMNDELLERITLYMHPSEIEDIYKNYIVTSAHHFFALYLVEYADKNFLDTILLEFGLAV